MLFNLEMFMEGGYAMVAIFIASVLALAMILYCLFILRRSVVLPGALVKVAEQSGGGADAQAAEETCQREGGPFAEILLTVIATRDVSREEAEHLVEGAGRRAAHTLSRGVLVLEVVAAIAPLLGLLGTVIGMYEAFQSIGDAGLKNIGELPTGISKALITTITGLAVAIPAYVAYTYFSHRVEDLILEMERYAVRLMARLRNRNAAAK